MIPEKIQHAIFAQMYSWWLAIRLTGFFATLYATFFIFGYFFADHLIFQPRPSSYRDSEKILKIPLPNGERISARMLLHPSAPSIVLYSHGNAEDLGDIAPTLQAFYAHGISIIAYDYPGYGTSTGTPSEQSANAAILATYEFIIDKLQRRPEEIVLVGRSVGSGPAVQLAAHNPVGGLVLESGFTSIFRVATRIPLLPFDKFDNLHKITSLTCPILIIHGTRDSIIPTYHGRQLYERAPAPKMHFFVDGAQHNNVLQVAGEQYWQAMRQFLELVKISQERR